MNKSDSAHPAEDSICIQQGDWEAYRSHIRNQGNGPVSGHVDDRDGSSMLGLGAADQHKSAVLDEEEPAPAADSAGQPLNSEEDILAFRRQCARAYIGMNGRLGGRAYRANAPVILTEDAVQELAELNRLLREERAQRKKQQG